MTRPLFVNHASAIAGAELILIDALQSWPGASVFLFDHGPLETVLADQNFEVTISHWGGGKLATMRRDTDALRALPLLMRFSAITLELAKAALGHDVIYANSQKAFVVAAIASALVRKPLIWHLHDIISAAHFGKSQRRLQITLANRRAARIIVPSPAAADAFIAEGGRPGLVTVVPNGLNMALDSRSKADIRAELALPEGPLVGVFSRLAAWKGQHVLLQALKSLHGVRCIVAGEALFGEQAYADHLNDLAAEADLAGRVLFLGPRSDVPLLMQAVDVMVHPSIHPEPFGRTLVEAMLAGTPVIASDAGACREVLDGGKAGTLVPPNDPRALADALTAVLARPSGLDAQLRYATERAKSLYGADAMRAAISTIITDVAKEARH